MDIKRNLFYYATSELSHDALLAYLFMNYKSNIDIVVKLLNCFTGIDIDWEQQINLIEVTKQENEIDLLVRVNTKNNKNYLIVIEDKIRSKINNNQIPKYYNYITSSDSNFDFDFDPSFIYFKLGFEDQEDSLLLSNFNKGKKYSWKEFYISDILDIFQTDSKIDYIINEYIEYLDYLRNKQSNIPVEFSDWDYYHFGFYTCNLAKNFKFIDF